MEKRMHIINNNAVAGVIEALLLVGLVAIILSFIQLYYIPEIMEEKEASHMDQVSQQLSQLKSVIEIQSTMGIINDENHPIAYTPMSSAVTLGSRQLPYFVSSASPGQVTLIDKEDAVNNTIKINAPGVPNYFSEIPLTSIIYEAYNSYFIPQKYILQGGGIILNQTDGEVMSVYPSINIINNTEGDEIEISFDIPLFIGTPGKKLDGGYDESYIRTNYIESREQPITLNNSNHSIYIYTDHPNAWYHCLVNTTRGLLWEYVNNMYKNEPMLYVTLNSDGVKIIPGSKNIYLKITVVEIGVQIGPGAVIS